MSAIEQCRTAALGGHVVRCDGCGHDAVSYNSCRNRHCPKCQSSAAQRWLEARKADLLPVEYYHVVFTLPAPIAASRTRTRPWSTALLFDVARRRAADDRRRPEAPRRRIGATLVLHTWGSALTHHPHVHGIVPGGGLAPDGRAGRLQTGLLPAGAGAVAAVPPALRRSACAGSWAGRLHFFGEFAELADAKAFAAWLAPLRQCEWVVYAKRPFAGPAAVLAYLSRYTHRVAISNGRLLALDERGVTFRWKDYRAKGRTRHKTMTLAPAEFMRRFLLHVLPSGLHRIRHYGLLANGSRTQNLAIARQLLLAEPSVGSTESSGRDDGGIAAPTFVCAHCGHAMIVVQTFTAARPSVRLLRRPIHDGHPSTFASLSASRQAVGTSCAVRSSSCGPHSMQCVRRRR